MNPKKNRHLKWIQTVASSKFMHQIIELVTPVDVLTSPDSLTLRVLVTWKHHLEAIGLIVETIAFKTSKFVKNRDQERYSTVNPLKPTLRNHTEIEILHKMKFFMILTENLIKIKSKIFQKNAIVMKRTISMTRTK